MVYTYGIFLINKNKELLVVHPTGSPINKNWSIPKGLQDDTDISGFAAALRELQEETGISLDMDKIIYITENNPEKYPVTEKTLCSWIIVYDDNFSDVELKCTSTYMDCEKNEIPENNYIAWIPFDFRWKVGYEHINLHPSQMAKMPLLEIIVHKYLK